MAKLERWLHDMDRFERGLEVCVACCNLASNLRRNMHNAQYQETDLEANPRPTADKRLQSFEKAQVQSQVHITKKSNKLDNSSQNGLREYPEIFLHQKPSGLSYLEPPKSQVAHLFGYIFCSFPNIP